MSLELFARIQLQATAIGTLNADLGARLSVLSYQVAVEDRVTAFTALHLRLV